MAQQKTPDKQQVRQMRALMAQGGDKAVEHRFGEQAKASAEYKEAQRQQGQAKRRAQQQRDRAAAERESRQHASHGQAGVGQARQRS